MSKTFVLQRIIPNREGLSMSEVGFWEAHGIIRGLFLCGFCAFLPRTTLLFLVFISETMSISFLGLVGWIVAPRILIAGIATALYWFQNPFICILAWAIAIGGEFFEKAKIISYCD